MAKMWWQKEDDKPEGEPEIPAAIQQQLDQVKELKATVEGQNARLSKLDSIESMLAEMTKPKPKPAPAKKSPEDEQAEREELASLLLSDPEAAYAKMAARTNAGVMQISAREVRREVFEDEQKFPYYTGEVKAEIHKMLAAQDLSFQNNPAAVENTYYTVVGKMTKEIQEGKIKDRFAAGSGSRGSGILDTEDNKIKLDSNDDIRKIAKQLGMDEKDYIKLLEEDAERYI